MKINRRMYLPVVFGAIIALVVVACGGDAATSTPRPAPTTATVATVAPTSTPTPAPPPSGTKRGGTLFIPTFSDLQTRDAADLNAQSYYIMGRIWSLPVANGNAEWTDNSLVPDLAVSWEASEGGLAWTVKINPDARWHDVAPANGRKVTAGDLKWYFDIVRSDQIESRLETTLKDIVSIEAADDETLIWRLNAPFFGFPNLLSNPRLFVQNREVFEQDGDWKTTSIGTGPYVFDRHEVGARIITTSNPNYWKDGDDGQALPYIDVVEQVVLPDQAAVNAGIRTGKLAFTAPGGIEPETLNKFRQDNVPVDITEDPKLFWYAFHGNNDKEPWKSNVNLRRAVMKAINQDLISTNAILYPTALWESPISSGMGQFGLPQAELAQLLAYDPDEAKRLLAAAGFGPGELQVNQMSPLPLEGVFDRLHAVINQNLGDIGIDTTITSPASVAEGFANLFGGKFDLALSFPGFEGDVFNWFRGYYRCGGEFNLWLVCDSQLDAMIADFSATGDVAKQVTMSHEMQRYILDQAIVVPLKSGPWFIPYQRWLKDFRRSWPWGFAGLERAWIEN